MLTEIEPIIKRKKFNTLSTLDKIQYIEKYYGKLELSQSKYQQPKDSYGWIFSSTQIASNKRSNILVSRSIFMSTGVAFLGQYFSTGMQYSNIGMAVAGSAIIFTGLADFLHKGLEDWSFLSHVYSAIFRRKQIRQIQQSTDLEIAQKNQTNHMVHEAYEKLKELISTLINEHSKHSKHQTLEFENGRFHINESRIHKQISVAQQLDAAKAIEAKV